MYVMLYLEGEEVVLITVGGLIGLFYQTQKKRGTNLIP